MTMQSPRHPEVGDGKAMRGINQSDGILSASLVVPSIINPSVRPSKKQYQRALRLLRSHANQALLDNWSTQIWLLKSGVMPSAIDANPCGFVR